MASAAFFGMLSTLFIKKYNPSIFNSYSLYITFIGIVSSFGLLGFDQMFLRTSHKENNSILIEKRLYYFIFFALIIFPVISLFFFKDDPSLNIIILLLTGWSINIIMYAYNTYRLKEDFLFSQALKNSYKISFFLIIVSFYLLHIKLNLLYTFSVILVFLAFIGLYAIIKYIKIDNQNTKDFYKLYFSFLINIGLLTALGFGERLVIKDKIGIDAFGKYFYYVTIFIFPLTLIQQYVGFKELVFFKKKIDKKIILKKIKIITAIGFAITLVTVLIVIIDNGRFLEVDLIKDKFLIFALFFLGLIKLTYGLFSAILGAKGKYKDLINLNIITIVVVLLNILVLKTFGYSIIAIIYALSSIFFTRTAFIYYKYVK